MIYKMKVGMTSSRHGPYKLGYTRVTMSYYNERQKREVGANL